MHMRKPSSLTIKYVLLAFVITMLAPPVIMADTAATTPSKGMAPAAPSPTTPYKNVQHARANVIDNLKMSEPRAPFSLEQAKAATQTLRLLAAGIVLMDIRLSDLRFDGRDVVNLVVCEGQAGVVPFGAHLQEAWDQPVKVEYADWWGYSELPSEKAPQGVGLYGYNVSIELHGQEFTVTLQRGVRGNWIMSVWYVVKGEPGPAGPQGQPGTQGQQGQAGPAGQDAQLGWLVIGKCVENRQGPMTFWFDVMGQAQMLQIPPGQNQGSVRVPLKPGDYPVTEYPTEGFRCIEPLGGHVTARIEIGRDTTIVFKNVANPVELAPPPEVQQPTSCLTIQKAVPKQKKDWSFTFMVNGEPVSLTVPKGQTGASVTIKDVPVGRCIIEERVPEGWECEHPTQVCDIVAGQNVNMLFKNAPKKRGGTNWSTIAIIGGLAIGAFFLFRGHGHKSNPPSGGDCPDGPFQPPTPITN